MRAILLASATATSLRVSSRSASSPTSATVRCRAYGETTPPCARNQQFAQVPIALFSRCAPAGLPPEEFLPGRQPEKGGELARAGETGGILNGRRHCRGGDRPNPEMLIKRRAVSFFCASFAMVR